MKVAIPRPFGARGRGRVDQPSVRCFARNQLGHYQTYCTYRKSGSPAKKGRFSGGYGSKRGCKEKEWSAFWMADENGVPCNLYFALLKVHLG